MSDVISGLARGDAAFSHRKIVLAARPQGMPKLSDFELVTSQLAGPGPGQCLVRGLYLSLDPYMRGRMDDRKSYAESVQVGQAMIGQVVGRVVASQHPGLQPGDPVVGDLGWRELAVVPAEALTRVDPGQESLSTALGILGMTGLTAYFGLLHVCQPQAGETVVISGAAGAVGSTVGQLAKIKGCRVVGVTGSQTKARYLKEQMGFDEALVWGSEPSGPDRLAAHCPDGIDVYFDNLGGAVTDAVVTLLNLKARVAVCGQSSQYNLDRAEQGPRWLRNLIIKRARIQGFLVWDFVSQHPQALRQLQDWLRSGKLRNREHVVEGIENAPRAFIEMLEGRHLGKYLVKLSPE